MPARGYITGKNIRLNLSDQGEWQGSPVVFTEVLNTNFSPGKYGPADGDPYVLAVNEAAKWFKSAGVKVAHRIVESKQHKGRLY